MREDYVSEEAKQVEDLSWDKFMDDIVKREEDADTARREYAHNHGNHPARELNLRIREFPKNRTFYNRKK